jgi:hypothetical protein
MKANFLPLVLGWLLTDFPLCAIVISKAHHHPDIGTTNAPWDARWSRAINHYVDRLRTFFREDDRVPALTLSASRRGEKFKCRNGAAVWRRRFSGQTQRRLWRRQLVCDTAAARGAIVLAPEYSPIDRCHGYTADCPRQAGWVGSAGAKTSMAPLTSRTSNPGSGLGAMGSWWASTCPVGENDVE